MIYLKKREGDGMAFTFGKRCTLCGGKLDRQYRCTECGLDNTKNDDMYKGLLNRNNCDDKPLTHVHHKETYQTENRHLSQQELKERLQKKYAGKAAGQKASSYHTNTYNTGSYQPKTKNSWQTSKTKQTKNKAGAVVGIIIAIFGVLPSLLGLIFEIVDDKFVNQEEVEVWGDTDYIEYEYENYLPSGFYTVGVHLPEGTYDIRFDWGTSSYLDIYEYVDGELNQVGFHYLDLEKDSMVEDIFLKEGMILKISMNSGLMFGSDDYAYDMTYEAENPLTESYYIIDQAVAGEDFPAGVYDIYYEPTSDEYENGAVGYISYDIWDSQKQEIIMGETLYVESYQGTVSYNNVALLDGAEISLIDLAEIRIVPSVVVDSRILEE